MSLPVPFGDVVIDPTAVAQQLAAVACVYQNGRADLAELFEPAQVVRFVHREDTWPPSYAVINWPDDQWLIVIAGTTNILPQVAGHIAGSFGRPGDSDPITVNGQWAAVWEEIREEVRGLIGDLPANGRVYISGHSYGGAVGAIAAVDYAGRWGGERIQLMQIGAPRAFTVDRPAEFPHVWHRVESTNDPVTVLPFSTDGVYIVQHWENPLGWLPRYPAWVHYGTAWVLSPGGQWASLGPDPDPLPPGVTNNPLFAHLLRNYWGRLSARFATDGGPPAYSLALDICDRVLQRPPQQTTAEELPHTVPGPDRVPFLVPGYNGIPPTPTQPLRFAMAILPERLDPPHFKLTHFFNWGENGWDESYWCNAAGGDNPMLTVVNAGIDLAVIRKKALYTGARYVGLRVSEAVAPFKSTPDKEAAVGAGKQGTTPLPVGSCVFVRQQDRTFLYDAERVYRGITAEWLGTDNVATPKITPTPAMQNWIQQMTNFLRAPYGGPGSPGGATVNFGIMAANKESDATLYPVTRVAVNNDGLVDITVIGDPVAILAGATVHLMVKRTRCARGLSGRHAVRQTAPTPGGLIVTLNKKFCCSPGDLATIFGSVRVVSSVMYKTYWFDFSSAGHRNTGRPNFSTAGRRPGRCC